MITEIPRVHVNDALEVSVRALQQGSVVVVGVVDDGGRLVGLVARETIDDLLMLDGGRRRGRGGVVGGDIKV